MKIDKAKIKAFVSTPKGRLIAACGALALVWAILIPIVFADFFFSSSNTVSIYDLKQELIVARRKLEGLEKQKKVLDKAKKDYKSLIDDAWRNGKDGMVEVALRQKIVDATTKQEDFKLSNIGSVRTAKLNDELYVAEIDVSVADTLDRVMNFVAEVAKIRPALTWKRLDIRRDMRNNAPRIEKSTNLATLNQKVESTRIVASGTLRVICFVDNSTPEIPKAENTDAPPAAPAADGPHEGAMPVPPPQPGM